MTRIATVVLTAALTAACHSDAEFTIGPETHTGSYDRDLFGDYDRAQVLQRNQEQFPDCHGLYSRYDNMCHADASAVHVDHLVPLAEAWRSGAWAWTPGRRAEFASNLNNLALLTARENISKSDSDPSDWLPTHQTCAYVLTWRRVKGEYDLTIDTAEAQALADTNCLIN